jgi:hypothetical protein
MLEHVRAKEIAIGEGVDRREQRKKENDHCRQEPPEASSYTEYHEISGEGDGRG